MKVALAVAAIWFLSVLPVSAQSGFNFGPDAGPQVARGSAWVARADSPLATFFNPAALVRQRSGVHIGAHAMTLDRCFFRVDSSGGFVSPGRGLPGPGAPNGPGAGTCMEKNPFLNPQIAAAFRATDRLAFGVAFVGPHSVGKQTWPETVSGPLGQQPAATRFTLVDENTVFVYPTISVGYALTDTLSIGGGVTLGLFQEDATIFAEGLSPAPAPGTRPADDFFGHQEIKVSFHATDHFFPGAVVGVLWSPSPTLDAGAWFKKSTKLSLKADITVTSRYWMATGEPNPQPCGPGEAADCNITKTPGPGRATEPVPDELRGGIRYHRPRGSSKPTGDAMVDDAFDIEFDLGWANNSVVKTALLDVGPGAGLPLRGVSGASTMPSQSGINKNWKDVASLRLGGEYVVVPGRLALQAGAFYETNGQKSPQDLHIHFDLAQKSGVSGGALLRVGRRLDLYVAYQHMTWADLDNGGAGTATALSGDATTGNETRQTVNGGRLASSMNEVASGLTFRF